MSEPSREPRRVAPTSSSPAPPGPDVAGVVALPPLIYAIPFGAGLVLQRLVPIHVLPDRLAVVIGCSLMGLSALLALWAAALMRQAGTAVNPLQPTTALVLRGPFRRTRNPLYLSLTGLYVGGALVAHALGPLLLLPAALWVLQRGVIEREEAYLERKFGAEYRGYRARVRRWF